MTINLSEWLESIGIANQGKIFHNPSRSLLVAESMRNDEGELTQAGAVCVVTAPYTGRSPNDKFIVDYEDQKNLWWGEVNQRMTPASFHNLRDRITAYLNNRPLYVIDCFVGADEAYRLSIRVVTEFAWQAIAIQNLFIYDRSVHKSNPDVIILAAPNFQTVPEIDQVNSRAAIAIDLKQKMVLIAASKYAGEIKKSIFTIMNAILPESGILPMHCSATVGEKGDVALYFGLSGTGKTTLSSTPDRKLVGDDEHGWGDHGVFNFEGGCYAKTIRLNPEHEPVIWKAVNQFGTVLENVIISQDEHLPDFNNARITENSRAAYPLTCIDNIVPSGLATHPDHLFFLTADAFGVMPPIAKLTPEQAKYFFLSGYTSKVAGTERGLGQQPKATFSTCFGEPFLALIPSIYAGLLTQKIARYNCQIWLVNTGWTAGDYNTGHRMHLPYTREMINWVLSGEHKKAAYHIDATFNLAVPDKIPGIPPELLFPEKTWQDQAAFQTVSNNLKLAFDKNFKKFEAFN